MTHSPFPCIPQASHWLRQLHIHVIFKPTAQWFSFCVCVCLCVKKITLSLQLVNCVLCKVVEVQISTAIRSLKMWFCYNSSLYPHWELGSSTSETEVLKIHMYTLSSQHTHTEAKKKKSLNINWTTNSDFKKKTNWFLQVFFHIALPGSIEFVAKCLLRFVFACLNSRKILNSQ